MIGVGKREVLRTLSYRARASRAGTMRRLRLVQLPVPQPAAYAATGNVPLAAGCLGVAARMHGLGDTLALDVLRPEATDALGDTRLADHVARDEPEFLGLSLYLWNVERSLHLAREVKRRSPRTIVLIGGPEVSPDNPFVLGQGGFDVAVMGEAEPSFGPLMRRILDGVPAAAAAFRGSPCGIAMAAHWARSPRGMSPGFALAQFPSPYLEGLLPVDPGRSTYVETVRGCKSHCTFCFYPRSSPVLRSLDVEASARLVSGLRDRGAREVVFLDPTFNHRPGFEPLLDALAGVNADRALSFFAEVRAEGLTPDHAAKLARAGFTRLEIGLQSVNAQTLKRVRRGGSPARVAAAVKMLHDQGISPSGRPDRRPPRRHARRRGPRGRVPPGARPGRRGAGVPALAPARHRHAGRCRSRWRDLRPRAAVPRAPDGDDGRGRLARRLLRRRGRLGRRLDELPRPHLVGLEGQPDPPDVFALDLDVLTAPLQAEPARSMSPSGSEPTTSSPGAIASPGRSTPASRWTHTPRSTWCSCPAVCSS